MKISLFICCSAFSICWGTPIVDHEINPSPLYEYFDIEDDAFAWKKAQTMWLRKPGQERWEMQELNPEARAFVLNWAKKMGLFDEWAPSQRSYDRALILGATTSRMALRLNYLTTLWKQGFRFREVVFLTGMRPLDPRVDEMALGYKDESEAAVGLWESSDLKGIPIRFISVPTSPSGRPTTEDTLFAWLNESPEPGTCLFVSDQPFCGYQFAVIKKILGDEYPFEMVGPGIKDLSHPAAGAIVLDSIARWIYQSNSAAIEAISERSVRSKNM